MQETLMKKSMTLVLDEGIVDGKIVFKRYTYSGVKTGASAQNLYDAALALAGLYDGDFSEVQSTSTHSVAN